MAIGTRTIFGTNDSIKTIVTTGADTIELSKSFGILRFPLFNSSHRYYKLLGIEASASYDSTALYGYKVPNAWDFYNYQVGDIFCESYADQSQYYMRSTCSETQYGILSKSISGTSITYTVDTYGKSDQVYNSMNSAQCYSKPFINSTSVLSYTALNSKLRLENLLYPNMVIFGNAFYDFLFSGVNLGSFKKDNSGAFYKAVGLTLGSNTIFPQGDYLPFVNTNTVGLYLHDLQYQEYRSILFSNKLGKVSSYHDYFEYSMRFEKSCFTRNNVNLYGNPYVGIAENYFSFNELLVYPNPFHEHLTIRNGAGMN
ncbi:MAG: hypothetical protein WCR21_13810, partial [Bacteroidota bacterium]